MEMIRQFLAVLGVIAMLGGMLWWLKHKGVAQFSLRRSGSGRPKSIEVVERLMLTPQHSLQLVRVAERVILVATSPSACTMLENGSWNELASSVRSGTEAGGVR